MRFRGAALLAVALAACRQPAPGFTLLFLRSSPAARLDGLSWAPDVFGGRVLGFDGHLRPVRQLAEGLNQPVAVAATCHDRLIVSEYTGAGVLIPVKATGHGEMSTPFPAAIFASAGCTVMQARSPYLVQAFAPDSLPGLVFEHDHLPEAGVVLGELHPAPLPFLTDAMNAGALAVDSSGSFYFAPMARDEIVKYNHGGTKLWTAKRGLYQNEREPRFLPNRGTEIPLLLARSGIALTLGPDGRLYSLGADDSTASRLRVDVLDTATGAILATRHLGQQETAVALSAQGQLVTFDADSLLRGAGAGSRESFASFALPDLRGDTVRLAHYAGKVTLVNFWASWCDPCREEFPHMATLYARFPRADFDIAAISDDVDPAKMRAWVDTFHPPFPILAGGGRMRAMYHYRGLPYSVLLDRHGLVVKRILGFGGAPEFQELAAAIAKEIAAP
ncbi:MAG TPA: TlpA disulfide reductase family protein [Gemmatimonadales bacterium]|nr:TlpA disulfide reductase family protein [Gemmatimonadales bacterium]